MIDGGTGALIFGSLASGAGIVLSARYAGRAATATAQASGDVRRQELLDAENSRQFGALRTWGEEVQVRFDALEARFDVQAEKLRQSEQRVWALEQDVHAGQRRELEMTSTIQGLQAKLELVQKGTV